MCPVFIRMATISSSEASSRQQAPPTCTKEESQKKRLIKRDRERDRDRQTDRQRKKDRQRKRDRERERQRETEREGGRERDIVAVFVYTETRYLPFSRVMRKFALWNHEHFLHTNESGSSCTPSHSQCSHSSHNSHWIQFSTSSVCSCQGLPHTPQKVTLVSACFFFCLIAAALIAACFRFLVTVWRWFAQIRMFSYEWKTSLASCSTCESVFASRVLITSDGGMQTGCKHCLKFSRWLSGFK